VVGSPDLWRVRARTPAQMRLANAFFRFAELAAAGETGTVAAPEAIESSTGYEILTLDLV
jgi:hypothetical protein